VMASRIFVVGAVSFAAFIVYIGKTIHELADALDEKEDE
jgi:hypothetical protein